jgi:hypothetical protein
MIRGNPNGGTGVITQSEAFAMPIVFKANNVAW